MATSVSASAQAPSYSFHHTFVLKVPVTKKGNSSHVATSYSELFAKPLCPGASPIECRASFSVVGSSELSVRPNALRPPTTASCNLCINWPTTFDLKCTAQLRIVKGAFRWSGNSISCSNGVSATASFGMASVAGYVVGYANSFDIMIDVHLTGNIAPSPTALVMAQCPASRQKLKIMAPDGLSLFNSGLYFDVVIKCADQTFKCHKVVLANRSDVLATMLSSDFKEGKDNVIVVRDIDPRVMRIMLVYIYTGLIAKNDVSEQLFRAAHLYNVSGLVNECSLVLASSLTMYNLSDLMELAHLYGDDKLFERCINFFKKNQNAIMTSPKWQEMARGNIVLNTMQYM